MQTPDKSGIICDYCGMNCSNDFSYYSFDFKNPSCHNNNLPSLQLIHNLDTISSYDICPGCFDNISKRVISNNSLLLKHRRSFVCEITGNKLSGSFDYYYCVITKVNVKITGQPYICTKCQKKTTSADSPCGCSNVNFVRPASINTITRFLEFSLCEEAYQTFRKKAEKIRSSPAEWSTKTE